jgi:hypothetical protein
MGASTDSKREPIGSDTKDGTNVAHVNSVLDYEKPSQTEERDWTGTAKKTDPEEIALVRKLDIWIMVRFSYAREVRYLGPC